MSELENFMIANNENYPKKFFELCSLFWKYATIKQVFEFFKLENPETLAINAVKTNLHPLPLNTHLRTDLRVYEFLHNYYFEQGRNIDPDTPADMSYIEIMTHYDILLTQDKGFMLDCFEYVHPNKEIMDLDTFLKIYG